MNNINSLRICVSKIVQKQRFVKDIFNSIYESSGRVLLVGGAVRDVLQNIEVKDLDFEVYGISLDTLQSILETYGTVSLVGKSFGVLRLAGLDVDWSLPRKDSNGRHPVVTYDPFMTYDQAFARRDVTINAMGIDMQTYELIDPFGGLDDLHRKILRSPAIDFFVQDPLRLLRVMQFAGRFQMQVDAALSQVCRTIDVTILSEHRVEQEFFKLFLRAKKPSIGLRWLVEIDTWSYFFPQIKATDDLFNRVDRLAQQSYQDDHQKCMVLLAAMYADLIDKDLVFGQKIVVSESQNYHAILSRVVASVFLRSSIIKIIWYLNMVQPHHLTIAQAKWLAYWIAPDMTMQSLLILLQVMQAQDHFVCINTIVTQAGVLEGPEEPLLRGKDFLDVATGIQLGKLVERAYQLQLEEGITDAQALRRKVINF
jgi:tRNA nucleotidyltransferase (CCA-adding enzyme)